MLFGAVQGLCANGCTVQYSAGTCATLASDMNAANVHAASLPQQPYSQSKGIAPTATQFLAVEGVATEESKPVPPKLPAATKGRKLGCAYVKVSYPCTPTLYTLGLPQRAPRCLCRMALQSSLAAPQHAALCTSEQHLGEVVVRAISGGAPRVRVQPGPPASTQALVRAPFS